MYEQYVTLKVRVNDQVVGLAERSKTQRMISLCCLKSDVIRVIY